MAEDGSACMASAMTEYLYQPRMQNYGITKAEEPLQSRSLIAILAGYAEPQ